MKCLLLFTITTVLSAQTVIDLRAPVAPPTSPSTTGYREGDWCAMPVFTRASDTVLVFTQDASPSRPCYLHTVGPPVNGVGSTNINRWMSAATITITSGVTFDDVVYFYWIAGLLHVSARTPNFTCDTGCMVDPIRTGEMFPAGSLVGGMYTVTAGAWDLSGHAIINEHQIFTDNANTVTYLPNEGYLFTMQSAAPPPATLGPSQGVMAAQLASSAVEEILAQRQRALADITKSTEEADNKTLKGIRAQLKALEDKRSLPSQVELQSVKDTLARLQVQAEILSVKQVNNQAQLQTAQQQVAERWIMSTFQLTAPPKVQAPCMGNLISVDKDNLYICSSGLWRYVPVKELPVKEVVK